MRRQPTRALWPVRWLPRLSALLLGLVAGAGCHYLELAGGQLAMINEQVPIARAYRIEADPERKRLLAMVPDIHAFAAEVMQLRPGRSYTGYYETEENGLTYVLVASERTQLSEYTWWFPVVGSVPYKSYFELEGAQREQAELDAAGYDTWIGRSTAYSTLGVFRDPVLTTMMRDGRVRFVEVLLHEMTHARLYVTGQTDWNEQFATFVARLGTEHYMRSRFGDGPEVEAELTAHFDRREQLEARVAETVAELEALYDSGQSAPVVLRKREPIFEALVDDLQALYPERTREELRMNNARLLQFRRYTGEVDDLKALWEQSGRRWAPFFDLAGAHAQELPETDDSTDS